MAPAKIYYIRKNKTAALPANVLILDTETKARKSGGVDLHRMYMGWTWRFFLGPDLILKRESWRYWESSQELADYIQAEARPKAPLYIVGSNVTFDLFASGLIEHLHRGEWKCDMLYDRGLTTILLLKRNEQRIKAVAAQNFLVGGVAEWGKLLGLPKGEVDFDRSTKDEISQYCRRDTEITGLVFVEYLRFVAGHNMGGFGLTGSGQSFRCFRHRFLTEKILHYDQRAYNQIVRAGYYGGRVECGVVGKVTGGPFTKLDVNSLYPAAMRHEWYPVKLCQWVRDPSVTYTRSKLASHCLMADCTLSTGRAAFPIRRGGKLVFPIGNFRTFLSTGSLRYALKHRMVTHVHQLLTFTRAKLFTSFVDEFYALRQRYKEEGNAVYEKTVKLMLNSLYGKFGEKREKVLHECDDEEGGFYRRSVLVPTEGLIDDEAAFDWRYHAEPWMEEEFVSGIEWSAFGHYELTAGEIEGPQSAPAIAAHVTDYGRMLLWRAMEAVGAENVLYTDTDSLIIPTSAVARLGDMVHPTRLGAWKVEETSTHLEIRGAKDYSFGCEVRRKGIRKDAVLDRQGGFTQSMFPGLYSLMQAEIMYGFPIHTIRKELTAVYDKGQVLTGGVVVPWVLTDPA